LLDDGKYKIIEETGKKNTKYITKVSLEEWKAIYIGFPVSKQDSSTI
jgi:hypothetical protein